MIEINLIQKKVKKHSVNVGGIDLSKLNLKMVGIALVVYFIQDGYLPDYFQGVEKEIQGQLNNYTTDLRELNKELRKHGNIEEKLKLYERRRKELVRRSSYVDQILKERTNPKKVLERLARSVPDDIWLEELVINQDREITIKGRSEAYKSIGDFLTMANESAFFDKSLRFVGTGSSTKDEVLYGKKKRVEVFEIHGKIVTFDPWQEKK